MKREAFDHAVRAAGAVMGEDEILIIGSQAIHGTLSAGLPPEAERSIEADVAALEDPDDLKADLVDGSIGEASMFHETFGYYAQGVSQTTAVLSAGWRDRLVRYETPATNGIVAWCLEVHDLWVAKAAAMRPKDVEFCRAVAARGLVDRAILLARVELLEQPLSDRYGEQIRSFISRIFGKLDR